MAFFDAQFIHWSTVAAFTAHLATVKRPLWCSGLTNHNTFIPNETQWRGLASMQSMQATYINKGWSAGPHLYLAAECPNPQDAGIWQMTPLDHIGVHAGPCNSARLGIENVGDFDARPPSPAQYQLLLDVNTAILRAWDLSPDRVNVHNECMDGRTCPGRFLTGAQIRTSLARTLDPFSSWGATGKPEGDARNWAIPKAWLANKALGACVRAEVYVTPELSIAVFLHGFIWYNAAKHTAIVEWL
jgi:hypothetical protein